MSEKIYSFAEAEPLINCNRRNFARWEKSNLIHTVKFHHHHAKNLSSGINESELKRIQKIISRPPHSFTINEFIVNQPISWTTLTKLIKDLKIQPLKKRIKNQLSPRQTYYDAHDLPKIKQAILNKKQAHASIYGVPNTEQIYNPKTDTTLAELTKKLANLRQVSPAKLNGGINKWIQTGNLKNHYSMDKNGTLFFTPKQVEYITRNYYVIDQSKYISTKEICQKLNVTSSYLNWLSHFCNVKPHRILGQKKVFYTKADAEKLKQGLIDKANHKHKYLITNTTKMYNPNDDYNIDDLVLILSQKHPVKPSTILHWIMYGKLTNHYYVDTNKQLFFTFEQITAIEKQYYPNNRNQYYTSNELAEKLKISHKESLELRQQYQIKPVKFLGFRSKFFSEHDVKKLASILKTQ